MENQIKDISAFNGGLNYDDEPRNIPNGDYLYAMACRNYNGLEQSKGAIQNVKGNTLIEFQLPSGDNTVIGSCTNVEDKAIIYFVYNSLKKHSILQYRTETRTIEKILWEEPILGFNPSHRIYHANVLDNKLFWTEGFNHPRKINISRAKEYTAGIGGYLSIDKQTIDSIKYPPVLNPVCYYVDKLVGDITPNRIAEFNWQLAYRYVYDDNEASTFSPFSLIPAQRNTNREDDRFNAALSVFVQTGHHTVKKIEVYARNNNNDVFNLIEVVEKKGVSGNQLVPDNDVYQFVFDNSGIYTPIAFDEAFRLFDNIPLKAFCQEIVDDNVLCYANITEGFDDVDLDVDIEADFQFDIKAEDQPQIFVNKEVNLGTSPGQSSVPGVNIPVGQSIVYWEWTFGNLGGDLILVFENNPSNQVVFRYDSSLPFPEEALALQIRDYLISIGINAVYLVSGGVYYIYFLTTNNSVVPDARLYRPGAVIGLEYLKDENFMSFKKGTTIQLGLVYYDYAGRTQGVLANDDMRVNVPWFSNSDNPTANPTDFYKTFLKYDIKHKPPIWAYFYQWVVVDSDLQFQQFLLRSSNLVDDGDNLLLGFNEAIVQNIDEIYPNGKRGYNTWTFEKGDRVRFIARLESNIDYLTTIIDREVSEFDDSTGTLTLKDLNISDIGLSPTAGGVFVEVYRPTRVSDDFFREIGYRHLIVNPGTSNRWHLPLVSLKVNIFNQGIPSVQGTLPNKGYIYGGNVFVRSRAMLRTIGGSSLETDFAIESLTVSDTIQGQNLGYGKFVSKSENLGQQQYITGIRHGGRLFIGTNFNDILRFSEPSKYLKDTNGPINKIHLVGYVLKCLQDTKLTSIYIGRVVVNAADGNTREALSNEILGTINPYTEMVGCVDPGSVTSNVRHMYFFDRINGQFYRDASNGLTPISEYKMARYFDDLSKNWGSNVMFCEFLENINELNVTTYSETLLNAQGTYDETEEANGFYGIRLTAQEAAQVPNGATVSFGDGNIAPITTNVVGRVVSGQAVILTLTIPSPNPFPSLEQDQPVFLDYRARGVGQTVVFHEDENRWKTFMPYVPNCYGRFGRAMVSFRDGQLWLHEDNETRNTFYGQFTPSEIKFASNIHAAKIKVYDNISQYTNSVWGSPNDGDISVPSNHLHPQGMISRLLGVKYRNKEGIFHAEFLRDLNTPGTVSHKILNGRRLRGELMIIRLVNTETKLVTLSKVIVYSQPSEISA
jgi:hypothetical protein